MAVLGTLQRNLLRLPVTPVFNSCPFQAGPSLSIHTTSQMQKALKNLSVQAVNKKKKKLVKALEKLERKGERILKPIEENEVSVTLKKEVRAGIRDREKTVYTSEQLEARVLLIKEWSRYKIKQHLTEMRACSKMMKAQEKALEKLKEESEELYLQAIQCDESLLPYEFKGPVHTPPRPDYVASEGNFLDKTNYFEEDPGLLADSDIIKKKRKR